MDLRLEIHLNHLVERYPKLAVCKEDIRKAYKLLETAYTCGRKLLFAEMAVLHLTLSILWVS